MPMLRDFIGPYAQDQTQNEDICWALGTIKARPKLRKLTNVLIQKTSRNLPTFETLAFDNQKTIRFQCYKKKKKSYLHFRSINLVTFPELSHLYFFREKFGKISLSCVT